VHVKCLKQTRKNLLIIRIKRIKALIADICKAPFYRNVFNP
jgi:hypothetical protein